METQIAANGMNLAAAINGMENGITANAKEFNGRPARGMGATIIITLDKNSVIFDTNFYFFTVCDTKFGALPAGQGKIAANVFNNNARKRAGFEQILLAH